MRSDVYGRFLSCLIFVPRENFDTEVRERIEQILMQAFNGISSDFTVHLSESALARMLIIVRTKPGSVPEFDVREIEKRIVKVVHAAGRMTCTTRLSRSSAKSGETSCIIVSENAFPAGYREERSVTGAVTDAAIMDALGAGEKTGDESLCR